MTTSVQAAFEALYSQDYDGLVRRAAGKTESREDAEDIVARSFTKLWRHIENGYRDDLGARLNQIIDSGLKDYWQAQASRRAIETPVGGPMDVAYAEDSTRKNGLTALTVPYATIEDVEFRTDFDRALRGVDEPYRDAFILTDIRGLSQYEAADLLGIDQATVSRRADIARAQIRKELS